MDENKNQILSAPFAPPDSKLKTALEASEKCMNELPAEKKAEKFDPLLAVSVATLYRVSAQRGHLTPDQIMDLVYVVGHCNIMLPSLILDAVKDATGLTDEVVQSAMVN